MVENKIGRKNSAECDGRRHRKDARHQPQDDQLRTDKRCREKGRENGADQIDTAINLLEAFINQINAFIAAGILTPAEGEPLVDAANIIVEALQAM